MGLEISGVVDYIGCLIGLQPIYIQQLLDLAHQLASERQEYSQVRANKLFGVCECERLRDIVSSVSPYPDRPVP
jgi:hypothetical protein